MAEIEAGNLYDMNKMLIAQTGKVLKGKALSNLIENVVVPYFQDNVNQYFMLLCHERRNYTVFNISHHEVEDYLPKIEIIIKELLECCAVRGQLYGISRTEDEYALEIWIKDVELNELFCYYLFPYDEGIIEI